MTMMTISMSEYYAPCLAVIVAATGMELGGGGIMIMVDIDIDRRHGNGSPTMATRTTTTTTNHSETEKIILLPHIQQQEKIKD